MVLGIVGSGALAAFFSAEYLKFGTFAVPRFLFSTSAVLDPSARVVVAGPRRQVAVAVGTRDFIKLNGCSHVCIDCLLVGPHVVRNVWNSVHLATASAVKAHTP